MTNVEQELISKVRKNEKELKEKALIPGNNTRFVSVSLEHKKVEHQAIYDRQLGKFTKIVYLTKIGGLTRANEIEL